MARADRALIAGGYDGLIISSGSQVYYYLDDSTYPFRTNPRYRAWLPDATPDSFVVYRPGSRPKLVFTPAGRLLVPAPGRSRRAIGWVISTSRSCVPRRNCGGRPARAAGRSWASRRPPPRAWATTIPPAVTGPLDYARAVKSPYEIECMALATVAGVRAHRAAEQAFRAGASEYEIHLAYCQAAGAREEELPYNNIIAFDRHAAVLHYQVLDRERPPGVKSFLIDAGAQHAGLCLRHHAHLRRRRGRVPGPHPLGGLGAAEARATGCGRAWTTATSTWRRTARSPASW